MDGVYRWFQFRGNPARDREGRIARWYCLMTVVDDRRREEDALEPSRPSFGRRRIGIANSRLIENGRYRRLTSSP
ncbi:hypothetical protein MES5069_270243 [Mesorhizobium escarrei]|uniref:PAC domain-containing protein n=1 Tax=Mesorhizobium escarrei TaxID=666018 RepID=A0ABN8JUJ1_9HYPH|nr:hypothetical protein MES5069_270243 [Mesorhizobium escarrei]